MLEVIKYVDVIIPLPLKGIYTYSTQEDELLIGQRVVVQFGRRKLYSAVVLRIHYNKPEEYEVKPMLAILDDIPVVNLIQLKLWEWMANYYMCNIGDVMNAALPASFKLASESKVIIDKEFDGDIDFLSANERILLDALSQKNELTVHEISQIINTKSILPFINELIRKEVIQIKEDLYDRYKEKQIKVVKFISSEKELRDIKLTQKQDNFITSYLKLVNKIENRTWTLSELLKNIQSSRAVFNALVLKGVFALEQKSISRLQKSKHNLIKAKQLSGFQKKALNEIKDSFQEKDVCLLHGVTSSGKTELYIKLIEEQLNNGKQVLYLLPEIALTTQIIKRLQKIFGNKVGVTHSHLNNSERVEIWRAVKQKKNNKYQYPIMLGARSSLFLPFDNLGLIIVDEEHDSSFKQNQISPRYNARDTAIYLAGLHNSKVLLGSATPSLETYYNVKKNKFGLIEMNSRFEGIALPNIQTIDIRKVHLKKQMVYQFAPDMLKSINEILEDGKQVILFQNRRGYSPVISCSSCAYTPNCNNCDVSLTYHKWNNHLKCHYCGYTENVPVICTNCNSNDFSDKGFGTEQIEEVLKEIFPTYITKRMDHDTTRGKNGHQHIITNFEQGRIDILVGTQMVTKGLDFDNVALVGILNADSMLFFPDFRAYERAFQLMLQVAGRSGRKGQQGLVLVQTYNEDHEIFKQLTSNNYTNFVKQQIKERKLFSYPPYNRLIGLTIKHKKSKKLDETAFVLVSLMRKSFGNRVLGPEYPPVSRIRNYYLKNILLKIENEASISTAKHILQNIIDKMRIDANYKSVRFILDVDPI